jgi:single-stranded-DNA-specific exonuclease
MGRVSPASEGREMSIASASRAIWREPATLTPDQAAISDHPLLSALLVARGVTTRAEAEAFFTPRGVALSDPYLLPDMERAVTLIREAIAGGERIGVFGDYDVDGLTATAMLVRVLRSLGADPLAVVPHRIDDGYGLNDGAIDRFAAEGVKLLISVDCGTSNQPELERALALGLRAIVVDHHEIAGDLPSGVAFVSPHRSRNRFPCVHLAAVGVAFQLVRALLGDEGADMYLPYVALGTVADVVDLRGENRALVAKGLSKLRRWRLPGVMALCAAAGIDQTAVRAWDIGFILGPRLNAAGRVNDPIVALNLLLADTATEATPLALRLNALNEQRQEETRRIEREAESQIAAMGGPEEWPALVVADPTWSIGVAGLVAGRLAERYGRPVVVLEQGESLSRGSARSGGQIDLVAALRTAAPLLERYGGHQRAAGLALPTDQIERFRRALSDEVLRACGGELPRPELVLDAEVAHRDLRLETLDLIERLEPFGEGNPSPKFLVRNLGVRYPATSADGKHLRFQVVSRAGIAHKAVFFGAGQRLGELRAVKRIDIATTMTRNGWNGRPHLDLHICDFRPSSSSA